MVPRKFTMADTKCAVCGRTQTIMKRCSRCRDTFYCSRECQRLDWIRHQPNCKYKMQETEPRNIIVSNEVKSERNRDEFIGLMTQKVESEPSQSSTIKLNEVYECKKATKGITASNGQSIGIEQLPSPTVNKQVEQLKDIHTSQDEISHICVCIKYSRAKYKVELSIPCSGKEAFKLFSTIIRVPVEKLKLIHKGKLQTEGNIGKNLKEGAVFLAFGEMAENEDGLDPRDIETIMKQLSVDRNVAIKALRKTNCLLDAIFEIGNGVL